jgi:(2R)-ethylmalonyl-CoA mutase
VNAGLRFITELCKMRAFANCGTRSPPSATASPTRSTGCSATACRSIRSGLTEQQPENNVYRILLEMLAVTLSKNARARAVQLPAWNEALGLPRPFDQQWSLRMQQVLAYETDLLEYGDIFDGSTEIAKKVAELKREAKEELSRIDDMGGAVAAVDSGYMKAQLVESNTRRLESIERGEEIVVGVNRFVESEPSPLVAAEGSILTIGAEVEAEQIARLKEWRASRDAKAVSAALKDLENAAKEGRNVMPASIACAKGRRHHRRMGRGVPRGVRRISRADRDRARRAALGRRAWIRCAKTWSAFRRNSGGGSSSWSASPASTAIPTAPSRSRCAPATPAWKWSYGGIRFTPAEIVKTALEEDVARNRAVDPVRQPCLACARRGRAHERPPAWTMCPIVVGGIVPPEDERTLKKAGVAAVYTPKDYEINRIMADLVRIVERATQAQEVA